jgi:hypothetical protein
MFKFTVMYTTPWSTYPATYGSYDTREQAFRAARKASRDERVMHAYVQENQTECGTDASSTPFYPIMHGTWRWGYKIT